MSFVKGEGWADRGLSIWSHDFKCCPISLRGPGHQSKNNGKFHPQILESIFIAFRAIPRAKGSHRGSSRRAPLPASQGGSQRPSEVAPGAPSPGPSPPGAVQLRSQGGQQAGGLGLLSVRQWDLEAPVRMCPEWGSGSGHRQVVTGCQSPGRGSLLLTRFLESSAAPLFVICFPEFPCLRPLSIIPPSSQVSPLFRKNSPGRKAPCNPSPDAGPRGPCGNSARRWGPRLRL